MDYVCRTNKVAITCMGVEPMVVELQRHIREGLESSCIFHGVFFISECCFFGFLVSMTTKITVQEGWVWVAFNAQERDCVFQVCAESFFFIISLAPYWQPATCCRERDDVAHCFCLRSHCCFFSPNSLKDNRSTVNCVLLRLCR